jgi:hypothetical protein
MASTAVKTSTMVSFRVDSLETAEITATTIEIEP